MPAKKKTPKKQKEDVSIQDIGLLKILVGFLKTRVFGVPDPIYEKVILLNKVKKKLKKISIKGLNFSKKRLTTSFGKILYEIYCYYYPLRKVIDFGKPSLVKGFSDHLVKIFSSEKQNENLNALLSEELMRNSILAEGNKKTAKKVKDMYKDYSRSFSQEQTQQINHIYSLGESLYQFLRFDLFLLLKKFAPDLKEDNIYSPPKLREVDITQVENLLKDFTDHVYMLNPDANYYQFIEHYGNFLGSDIIPKEDFEKFFKILVRLIKTDYLILLVQYTSKDVFFRPIYSYSEKNALREFLKEIASVINRIQNRISQNLKIQKIQQLLKDLFGTTEFMELTTYTPKQSEYLIKNNIGTFPYTDPLNSVKKFLLDKYNHYLRKTIHSFILKASFVSTGFRDNLNTLYYKMNELVDTILNFEKKMNSKEGWDKILNLIRNKGRDSSLVYLAKKYVTNANHEVQEMLNTFIDISSELKEKIRILVTAYNKGETKPVANIKNFAGTTTVQTMKYLAQGFNDINKILSYLQIVMVLEEE